LPESYGAVIEDVNLSLDIDEAEVFRGAGGQQWT
jgi:hypothetical protein